MLDVQDDIGNQPDLPDTSASDRDRGLGADEDQPFEENVSVLANYLLVGWLIEVSIAFGVFPTSDVKGLFVATLGYGVIYLAHCRWGSV